MVLFADDTNISCSGENLQQLVKDVTKEMKKLKIWFDRNKLSLNLNKTKIMLFVNCNMNIQVNIQIDGVIIDRVHENKFLGVIIDDRISWKSHINHVQSKLSISIAVLNKVKQVLDQKSLHMLYFSLVLPYLIYFKIWGQNCKSSLHSFSVLQKKINRNYSQRCV